MREILFRGKRIDNGEWVEGHLYTQVYCPGTIEEEWYWIIKPIGSETWVNYRVDHSAVGQYTGLKDMNGKRIFEGDIVKRIFLGVEFFYCIKYDEKRACFIGVMQNTHGFSIFSDEMKKFEIIGNIHDNPELLEGGRDE